jgi:hypothetical protein
MQHFFAVDVRLTVKRRVEQMSKSSQDNKTSQTNGTHFSPSKKSLFPAVSLSTFIVIYHLQQTHMQLKIAELCEKDNPLSPQTQKIAENPIINPQDSDIQLSADKFNQKENQLV